MALTNVTLLELLAMDEVRPGEFQSRHNGDSMANSSAIVYGGCTLALGLSMASSTVPPEYNLYSMTGSYLGPGLVDRKIYGSCRVARQTSTFATRLVELSQVLDNGQRRTIMIQTVDFHKQEPSVLLEFSAPPSSPWAPHSETPSMHEALEELVRKHQLSPKVPIVYKQVFQLRDRYFDHRPLKSAVATQNLTGMLKHLPTTQDHLPIHEKTSADWIKTKEPINSLRDSTIAGVFLLDGGLAFAPLMHNHQFLDDAGASSSLDFAFRVFRNDFRMDHWNLRELKTITAGEGRSYSEARLWNEQGQMVANMTQQCILRPPKKAAPRKGRFVIVR